MKQRILDFFGNDFLPFTERYFPGGKLRGHQYHVLCPWHDDHNVGNFDINVETGQGNCFSCGQSGDIFSLYAAVRGLNAKTDFPAVLNGIAADFGIPLNGTRPKSKTASVKSKLVKAYDYHDASGKMIFQVCRFEPGKNGKRKTFLQRQPGKNGKWIWNMKGIDRVLYRLPAIVKAPEVFICEGEKDADNLAKIGFAATTIPGGAGKWFEGLGKPLAGKDVVILPDNDQAGESQIRRVAWELNGVAASIKVVRLPDLPPKGDVTDYLNRFKDPDEAGETFSLLVEGAGPYQPDAKPESCQVKVAGEALGLHEMKDAVSTTDVCFLWKEYVPAAMPFIIYAREGAGKTTIALFICKEILKAYPEGTILWIAAEGATLDTLDKALKMGLPEERFRFVRKTGNKTGGFRFNLRDKKDRDILDGIISNHNTQGNVLAVITDSIRGGIGEENDSSAGKIMQDVNEIVCDKHGLACGYIHHENKSTTADARDKMSGSTTIPAAVRHTFRIIETKSAYRRILRVIKSNLREPKSVTRLSAIKVSDNTMLFKDLKKSEDTKKASAEKFLLDLFAANELKPLRARFIFAQGEEAGFNKDNIKDAKRELALKSFRYSGGTAPWYWRIKDE